MDALDIEQHKMIVLNCEKLLSVCLHEDYFNLKRIYDKSRKIIDEYNNLNLTVSDYNDIEKGLFFASVKKVIYGHFMNGVIKNIDKKTKCYYDVTYCIKEEFKKACNKTYFNNDLMMKFILLSRRVRNGDINKDLHLAIKDIIHIQIKKTFQEQNEELIKKYI